MAEKFHSKYSGLEIDKILDKVAGGIPNESIEERMLADKIVTTSKIIDGAVTKEKLSENLKNEIDTKAGLKTADGGEIFNDYKNNQAISDKTTSSGTNTIAGCKGFYWYDIDFSTSNPVITITNQRLSPPSSEINTGYVVGDIISIVNDAKYIDCSTITAIGDNTITVDALPFTEVVDMSSDLNFDDYTLCVLEKPTSGQVDLGIGANASGEGTKALGAYSNVKGKGNIGKGQYSDIGGRDNEGGYCAHIGGRENKGGSYDLIGGYKNNSDGGANVIGGVGNLNDGDNNIMGGRDNINHGKSNVIGGAENLINKGHHFIGMFGKGHISSAWFQLFGGAWSKATANTLFAIGNGTKDTKRSNAFEVLKDGRAILGAEPVNDMEATNKKYVDNNSANPLIRKAEGELIHIDDIHPQVQNVDFNVNLDNATETVDSKFIYVCGKNLLNLLDANGDVQGTYRGWLVNPTKQKITMRLLDKDTTVDISGIYLGMCDSGSEAAGGVVWFINKGEVAKTSYTIDRKYISIYKSSTMTFKEAIRRLLQRFYIQVEFGTVATSYENFKGGKYEISETSISAPAMSEMNVYTNVPGAQIECEYNQDTNAVIEKLTNAVISLGGSV